MTEIILISFGLIIVVLVFRPVPIVSESKALSESGIVTGIYSNKGNGIIFMMKTTKRKFYINKGLENRLELNHLRKN